MTDIMRIPPEKLGEGSSIKVRVLPTPEDLYYDFALTLARKIQANNAVAQRTTVILPVGPTGQYPRLARIIHDEQIDCRKLVTFNMDEYCLDNGSAIAPDHAMSFEGFMERQFFSLIPEELRPDPCQRFYPDPQAPERIGEEMDAYGGVDLCFGGIGINGHIAFNEAPEPGDDISDEAFRDLPTRVLDITRETRVINAVFGTGGNLDAIPSKCVTLGMRELLASRQCRFYCDWHWQRAVVRKAVHGPVGATFPGSFLQTHPDATIVVADCAAALPGSAPE